MPKILMIGDGNHYFNRKLAEKLVSHEDKVDVDFFSLTPIVQHVDQLPYHRIFDSSIDDVKIPFPFRIRGLKGKYRFKRYRQNLSKLLAEENYDVLHLQSINYWIVPLIKKKDPVHPRIVLTVWGSDFYRAKKSVFDNIKQLSEKVEKISFASNKVSNDFDKYFRSAEKHNIIRFGLETFDSIDNLRNRVDDTIPVDTNKKVVVTLGYNRHPAQQHLDILDSLQHIDRDILDGIKIILPFTYGPVDQKYREQLEEKLNLLDVEYLFLNDFMDSEQVARNCMESDIMIQLQTTDAFSGSMQEYMYAGNVIITGSWLPYDDLKQSGVSYVEIDNVKDVSKSLTEVYTNLEQYKVKCSNNPRILKDISSWENNIVKWRRFYD